jgi:Tfp pilus assembly protein PilX
MTMSSFLRRIRRRLAREEGWVLVTAMLLMGTMLSMGLATFAFVDGQQSQSGVERQKDTAFNLAEAALNAEVFALSSQWPGQGAGVAGSGVTPYPTCTPSSTDTRCPNATTLQNLFATPDTVNGNGATWQTQVFDNGTNAQGQSSASFYSDTITSGQPSYDANGDGKLWVRAQATVQGRTRVLVAVARVQLLPETLPHATIIAGSLQTSNNGRKVIIDTQGSAMQPAPVYVRCTPAQNPNCLVYDASKGQISPDTTSTGYGGGPSLSAAALARLRTTAIQSGTFYSTCPASLPSAAVTWIDTGDCSYTGNATINSATNPGLLIVNNGTLSLGGTVAFYGLVYGVNPQATSGTVVRLQGNASIQGGVAVDGNGGVVAGSSKLNITFDDGAYQAVKSYGTSSIVQNTFREIATP